MGDVWCRDEGECPLLIIAHGGENGGIRCHINSQKLWNEPV
jgi:hypothetical protein